MNVSEYIVKYLEQKEIDKMFGVVGGASLWLCKAFGESEYIKPVFTNHEQAAVMAAEGWARITGKPGIVMTINGPGMTNAVTGIAQAWTDSAPIIMFTGNSNLKSIQFERDNNLRQYGTQDVRTDLIMQGITKKCYLLENPSDIQECLDEAFELAMSGRPGPIVIEVPINIQSSEVPYELEEKVVQRTKRDALSTSLFDDYKDVLDKLNNAKRPVILAGQGVRLSGLVPEFRKFVDRFDIPVVNSRMGIDSITTDDIHFVGRCGNHGDRPSHFAIQTCDVLLVLGCRLAPNVTGYDVSKFSNQSYKIMIEIDPSEKRKNGVVIDKTILSDLGDFLKYALTEYEKSRIEKHDIWVNICQDWRKRYPILLDKYFRNETISTYRVVDTVSKYAKENDLILSDTGSCCCIVAQAWQVKAQQRLFISGGLSAMGYYATSIGLALAKEPGQNVICFVGDGSLQMNIQELATICRYNLPIKMITISNSGYQFVRMSQGAYGINPPFGTDVESGVSIPDIKKVVEAYGIHYVCCNQAENLDEIVKNVLASEKPECLEIFVDENQEVCPRLKSVAQEDGTFVSPEYANLYPFLGQDELKHQLDIAKILDE